MNESQQMAELSLGLGDETMEFAVPRVEPEAPSRLWAADDAYAVDQEPQAVELGAGLANVGFLWAALRRTSWLWCATAALGLLAGIAYFAARPPAYQATATVLMPPATYSGEILDYQTIAQSRTVASAAVRALGLHESAVSFAHSYTVIGPTDRILIVTAKATSSAGAVREANAVASAFLSVQASLLKAQDQLATASIQDQINASQQNVDALTQQINQLQLGAGKASAQQQAKLSTLKTQRTDASAALTALKAADVTNQAQLQTITTTTVKGSRVLDGAVAVAQSRLKLRLVYALIGLIVGLALGAGVVIVRALVSDRLRWRAEVAHAVGAPVRLSVGKVRVSRRSIVRRFGDGPRSDDVQRVVAHLGKAVPVIGEGRPATLVVVPADDSHDANLAALCLVSLARERAQQGWRVAVADLCTGSPAARLLEVTSSGMHRVKSGDVSMLVAVPAVEDVAPVGPFDSRPRLGLGWSESCDESLVEACKSADLLVTLAALDASTGGEHLAGWGSTAIVVVSAGRSSAVRLHAVGEMIRTAGIEHISAVLVGVDKDDESLGISFGPVAPDPSPARSMTTVLTESQDLA